MRRISSLARLVALSTLVSAWAVAPAGCIIVNDGHDHDDWSGSSRVVKETRRFEIAHQPATPMYVRTENGSIEVDAAPQSASVVVTAIVRAKTEERLANTKVIAERDAEGAVRVSVAWPDDKRLSNEGCSFEIVTPDARGVDLDTSNGSVRIAGLSGGANLVSSNGKITIASHQGDVTARTSNGNIDAERISGSLNGRTSNGGIGARDIGGAVDLDTSNGSVDVRLADSSSGPVRVDSSNGGVDVECGKGFSGSVVMSTSNASTRFRDGSGRVIRGKDRLEASVGAGGPRSTISTSNGSIEVRVVNAADVRGSSGL